MTSPNPPADPGVKGLGSSGRLGVRSRCMGPWPRCGHAEGACTASPDYQAMIAAKKDQVSSATRIPAPANGQVASQREAVAWLTRGMNGHDNWMPWEVITETRATRFKADVSYRIGRRQVIQVAEHTSPTDQSSDVSSLVEALTLLVAAADMGEVPTPGELAEAREALAQAKRAGEGQ